MKIAIEVGRIYANGETWRRVTGIRHTSTTGGDPLPHVGYETLRVHPRVKHFKPEGFTQMRVFQSWAKRVVPEQEAKDAGCLEVLRPVKKLKLSGVQQEFLLKLQSGEFEARFVLQSTQVTLYDLEDGHYTRWTYAWSTVKALHRKGLVGILPPEKNSRFNRVVLTDKGKTITPEQLQS